MKKLLSVVLFVAACGARSPAAGPESPPSSKAGTPLDGPTATAEPKSNPPTPTCADGRDDTPSGGFGYGGGGYGPGGVRTGFNSTSICFGDGTSGLGGNLAAIRATVMKNAIPLKVCYEKVLDRDATIAGTTTATFTVLADGSVKGAQASGMHRDVDACVAREIATIEFAVPVEGAPVVVTLPITFQPPKR